MAFEKDNKFHASPQDPEADRKHHLGQYEYRDVTFVAADTDTVVTYQRLTPEDPQKVRFLDVNAGEGRIYRSRLGKRWERGFVVLRSDTAPYSTRILLFEERNEG